MIKIIKFKKTIIKKNNKTWKLAIRKRPVKKVHFFRSLEEQVLTRFEEENDGNVVKATLCLLETSRHGLLETELLQMLGDETLIIPPNYNEYKASDRGVTHEGKGVYILVISKCRDLLWLAF